MRIKSDFVTNSSSSAFIVLFDKIIKTIDDITDVIPVIRKAEQVIKDSLSQKPIKITEASKEKVIKSMIRQMSCGHINDPRTKKYGYLRFMRDFCTREGITESELYKNPIWMKSFYKETEVLTNKILAEIAKEFIEHHEGKYYYIFQYADEDGEFFSDMEHGGTFNKLPHIQISMH